MSTKTIEQFFSGKSLEIPPYQRDYAWETDNIDDLLEDISEAMEMGVVTIWVHLSCRLVKPGIVSKWLTGSNV